jgi:hypothetical protein
MREPVGVKAEAGKQPRPGIAPSQSGHVAQGAHGRATESPGELVPETMEVLLPALRWFASPQGESLSSAGKKIWERRLHQRGASSDFLSSSIQLSRIIHHAKSDGAKPSTWFHVSYAQTILLVVRNTTLLFPFCL